MKFYVNSTAMDNMIKRATKVISQHKFPVAVTENICLTAENDTLRMTVHSPDYSLELMAQGVVTDEPGCVLVHKDAIENFVGLSNVPVYEAGNGRLTATDGKKRRAVAISPAEYETWNGCGITVVSNADSYTTLGTVEAKTLLNDLTAVNPARATDAVRPVLTSFIVRKNDLTACDGFMLIRRFIKLDDMPEDMTCLLPGYTLKDLKVICGSALVSVSASDKYMRFEGDDFVYTCRLMDVEPIDCDKIIPDPAKTGTRFMEYTVSDLESVVTGAEKVARRSADAIPAVVLSLCGGKTVVAARNESTLQADFVESSRMISGETDRFDIAFNPAIILKVLKSFADPAVWICFSKAISPALLMEENTIAMALPIRIIGDSFEAILNFITPLFEDLQKTA